MRPLDQGKSAARIDTHIAGSRRCGVRAFFVLTLLALAVAAGDATAEPTDAMTVRIDTDPVILVLPPADGARTVSFAVGAQPGKLTVEHFDPDGHSVGTAVSAKGRVSVSVGADGPRQLVVRADRPTDVTFEVSSELWALYFPAGRGAFAALRGERLLYFPKDPTPGVLPSIRVRLVGLTDKSQLDRLNVRWRVAPKTLRFGPYTGRFDHSFTAECRGGEVFLSAAIDCTDTMIQFPDRPFAVVSQTTGSPAIVQALKTMVNVLPPAKNLLENGGFEDDVDGNGIPDGGWWRYNPFQCDLQVVEEPVHSGRKALQCGVPSGGVWVGRTLPVSPGDRIRMRFWAATKDLDGEANGMLGLRDKNRLGWKGKGDVVATIPAGTNDWKQYEIELTVPDEAAYFYCSFGHKGKRGKLYVDDVTLTRLGSLSASISPRSPRPVVGTSAVTVRLQSRANGPDRVQVSAKAADGQATTIVADVNPRGGQVDVSVPVAYPGPGRHEVSVRVTELGIDLFDMEARALADFKTAVTVPDLFYTRIVEPCYVCLEDEVKHVTTEFNLNASEDVLADLEVSARLLDAKDTKLWEQTHITGSVDGTVVRVPIEGLGQGDYIVELTLSGKGTDKPVTRKLDFHIVRRGDAVVTIDENQKLVAGGKPFFPIGIWPFHDWQKVAVETGANCLMNWTWASFEEEDGDGRPLGWMKWALDEGHRLGLKLMAGTPMREVYGARFKSTRRRVKALRDHPGLLVWEEDEIIANAGLDAYESVKRVYDICRREDPNHPYASGDLMSPPGGTDVEIPTLGGGSFVDIVFPPNAHDIAMWWWYPIPLPEDADGFGDPSAYEYVTNGLKLAGDKPLWLTLQVFAWTRTKDDRGVYRFPTIEEIRCMTYLAAAWGVDGVWYYGFVGGGESSDHMSLRTNKELLGQFCEFTKQLRKLEPVLCAADERDTYRATPKDFAVDSVMKTVAGRKYLIAANRNREPRDATFRVDGLGGKTLTVFEEGRTIQAKDGVFADRFVGFGTHVYVWDE